MNPFNPRILEASIRDVFANLSDIQTADVLLYALQHLPMQGCRTVMENAVESLLQVPYLPSTNVASALLLRAKRRLVEGYCTTTQKDLQSTLIVDPANQDVKAVIQSQPFRPEISLRAPGCCFSAEIWWEIALFLPRRDLRSLLFASNGLSRIASLLLFREIDLQFQTHSDGIDDEKIDTWHNKRSADILTQMLVNPRFAGRVRDLSISVDCEDNTPPLAFILGMLMNALSKLLNLRKVHCSGNKELISGVLQVVHSYNPHLQRLSLVVTDCRTNIEVPSFKHLTHFGISSSGGSRSSTRTFLEQSRDTLRYLSIKNSSWSFPAQAVFCHLAQIEFNGNISMDIVSVIFTQGRQLESVMLSGRLKCALSPFFRQCHAVLPFLRHFSFEITGLRQSILDRELCSAISEFLRERTELRTYRLLLPSEDCDCVGFDASAWSVLPALSKLSSLSIMFPEDLPPAVAGWLIPRSVRALTLDLSLLDEDFPVFMKQLHSGMPPMLRYIGIKKMDTLPYIPASQVVKYGFPNVRVVQVDESVWTVTRSGEDSALNVEEWPYRRAKYHSAEWLESLGCADAIWEGWTVPDMCD